MTIAAIGIGSNIKPHLNINRAKNFLSSEFEILKESKFIQTSPIGYKKQAPYDRIIATCSCPDYFIDELSKQLKDDGIIIAPIGAVTSSMIKVVKHGKELKEYNLGSFTFVPLTGEKGF